MIGISIFAHSSGKARLVVHKRKSNKADKSIAYAHARLPCASMTAGSLSCGMSREVRREIVGPIRSRVLSREAQCTLIAIDGALREEGEAILRIGNKKPAENAEKGPSVK